MSGSVQPGGGQSSTAIAPLPSPKELVWAKVPGWQWWPARLLPLAKELRTTDEEQLVLFLVDRTVSRVPSTPPLFHVHYQRFLGATYGNKKLFQAVEEARALLVEGSAAEQPLLAYPLPTREDMKKSSRQLLQFIRQAAVEPSAPLNKLNDQACKRVLHAVRNNRLVAEDKHVIVLPPEQPTIVPPATAAVPAALADSPTAATTATSLMQQGTASAAASTDRAKRQRKPQAWLQHYGSWAEASKGRAAGGSAPAVADASKPPGAAAAGTAATSAAVTKGGSAAAAAAKGGSAAAAGATMSKQLSSTSTSKVGAPNTRATPPPQQQRKVGPHMAMLRKKLQEQQQLQRAGSGPTPRPPLCVPTTTSGAPSSKAAAATAAEHAGRSRAGRPRKRTAAALAAAEQADYDISSSGSGSDQLSSSSDEQRDVGSEVSSGLDEEQQQQRQCRQQGGTAVGMEPTAVAGDQLDKHRKKRKVMSLNGCGKQGDNELNHAAAAGKRRVAASADYSGNDWQQDGSGACLKRRQDLSRLSHDQESEPDSEQLEGYSTEDADLSDGPHVQRARHKHAAAGRGSRPSRLHLSSSSAGGSGSCRAHNAAAAAVAAAFGGLGSRQHRKRQQLLRQECVSPQLLHAQQQQPVAAGVCCTCHQPLPPPSFCLRGSSTSLPEHMHSRPQHGVKQLLPSNAGGIAGGGSEGEHLARLGSFGDWQQQQQQLYGGGSGGCSSSSMEQCLALLDTDLDYALDVVSGGARDCEGEVGQLQALGVQQQQQHTPGGGDEQQQLQLDVDGEQTLVDVQAGPHEGLLSPTGQPLNQLQVAFNCDSSDVQPLATSAECDANRSQQQTYAQQQQPPAAAAVAASSAAAPLATAGEFSSPLLHRSLSPLLGPTLADTAVGVHMAAGVAELLPGLEEDLQHAAAMFGHTSPLTKHWDTQADEHGQDDLLHSQQHPLKDQQGKGLQQVQQEEQQHADIHAAATSPKSAAGSSKKQQQQQRHFDSPHSCSHHAITQQPAQWVLLHEKGKGPKGVKEVKQAAAAAAAAAVRHHHGTRRQSASAGMATAAAVASAQECNCGSSACGKVRGLCRSAVEPQLAATPHKLARCDAQQQACNHAEELKRSKETVQEQHQKLKQKEQQLQEQDAKIAELSSQTAAQAQQLQQQAEELMALKGLLVRIRMGEASAAIITAALNQQGSRQVGTPAAPSGPAACAGSSALKGAADKATATAAAPKCTATLPGVATSEPAAAEAATAAAAESNKPEVPAHVLQQQVSDLQLLVTALEQQLQDTRRKSAEIAKQQEAQVVQIAARLAAAEQDLAAARQQLLGAALLQARGLAAIMPPQRGRVRKTATAGARRSAGQTAARCATAAGEGSQVATAAGATAAAAAAVASQAGGPAASGEPEDTAPAAAAATGLGKAVVAMSSPARAADHAAAAPAGLTKSHAPPPPQQQQQPAKQQQPKRQQQCAGNAITAAEVFKRPPQVALPLTLPGARSSSIGSNSSNSTVVNMHDLAAAIASLTNAGGKALAGHGDSPSMPLNSLQTAASLHNAGSANIAAAAKAVTAGQGATATAVARMPAVATAAQVAAAMQATQNGSTIYALQMPTGSSPNATPLLVLKPQVTTLSSLLALNAAHHRMVASLSAGTAAAAGFTKAAASTDTAATTCVLNLATADSSKSCNNSSGKAAGRASRTVGGSRVRDAAAAGAGLWLGDAPSDTATGAGHSSSSRGKEQGSRSIVPRILATAKAAAGSADAAGAAPDGATASIAPLPSAAAAGAPAVKASTRAEAVPVVAAAVTAARRAGTAAADASGRAAPAAVPAAVLAEVEAAAKASFGRASSATALADAAAGAAASREAMAKLLEAAAAAAAPVCRQSGTASTTAAGPVVLSLDDLVSATQAGLRAAAPNESLQAAQAAAQPIIAPALPSANTASAKAVAPTAVAEGATVPGAAAAAVRTATQKLATATAAAATAAEQDPGASTSPAPLSGAMAAVLAANAEAAAAAQAAAGSSAMQPVPAVLPAATLQAVAALSAALTASAGSSSKAADVEADTALAAHAVHAQMHGVCMR